jgi:hypothetical protein
MDALPGFIRTQDQARHIAADVGNPCCPANQRAVVGHPSADRLWDGNDRKQALCPSLALSSFLRLFSSSSPQEAVTLQVVPESAPGRAWGPVGPAPDLQRQRWRCAALRAASLA